MESPSQTSPTAPFAPAPPTRAAPDPPDGPTVLGRYRLRRPLGAGAFGTVWLAQDERLERDVAVKVLPRERVIGGRFEREARAAARLSHPAIVRLYEAAVDDDAAYLVSELVRGATFGRLLEDGRLSDRDIVTIGSCVCDALEHAHSQSVIHRDVKPSNILVPDHPSSPGEVAKLTDFGVARLIGADTLTHTGDVVGTAAYMAPEQAEGRAADAAADLYSLALVLYEALTGLNPLATMTAAERTRRVGAQVPPLRRHRRDLPRDLAQGIDLALEPRADDRGSLATLRAVLARVLEEVDDRPGVIEPPWPTRTLAPTGPFATAPGSATAASASRPRAPTPALDGSPGVAPPVSRRVRGPARALAAAAAALAVAWLAVHAFATPPLAPAQAAVIAALAVVALPRLGWLGLSFAAGAGLIAAGRPGTAIVVLLGAAVPIVLLSRRPTRWPLAAAAPALGALLIAGAWPALAARDGSPWRRGALGACGWIWIALTGLIAGSGVYTPLPRGIPARSVWMGSVDQTVNRALLPLLRSGLLVPAVVWAAAAVVLPWLLRGPLRVRVVVAVVWSAGLASATAAVLSGAHAEIAPRPGMLVLGAVAAGVIALIPAAFRRRSTLLSSPDTPAGLA